MDYYDVTDYATGLPMNSATGDLDWGYVVAPETAAQDTNAGANPAAAAATTPVTTKSNGTTSLNSWVTELGGLVGSVGGLAAPVTNLIKGTQQTVAQANQSAAGQPAAGSLASMFGSITSTTWIILGAVGILAVVLIMRRK